MFQVHQKIYLLHVPVQAKSEKKKIMIKYSQKESFCNVQLKFAPFGLRYENELVKGKNHLLLKITGGCLGQQTC